MVSDLNRASPLNNKYFYLPIIENNLSRGLLPEVIDIILGKLDSRSLAAISQVSKWGYSVVQKKEYVGIMLVDLAIYYAAQVKSRDDVWSERIPDWRGWPKVGEKQVVSLPLQIKPSSGRDVDEILLGLCTYFTSERDKESALYAANQAHSPESRCRALLTVARIELQKGDKESAQSICNLVLEKKEFIDEFRFMSPMEWATQIQKSIAEIWARSGKIEEAKEIANTQLDHFTKALILADTALAQAESGEEGAQATFAEAIKVASRDSFLLVRIAVEQAESGDKEGAQETFARALTCPMDEDDHLMCVSNFLVDQAYNGNIEGAFVVLEQLKAMPLNKGTLKFIAEGLASIADAMAKCGRIEEAEALVSRIESAAHAGACIKQVMGLFRRKAAQKTEGMKLAMAVLRTSYDAQPMVDFLKERNPLLRQRIEEVEANLKYDRDIANRPLLEIVKAKLRKGDLSGARETASLMKLAFYEGRVPDKLRALIKISKVQIKKSCVFKEREEVAKEMMGLMNQLYGEESILLSHAAILTGRAVALAEMGNFRGARWLIGGINSYYYRAVALIKVASALQSKK